MQAALSHLLADVDAYSRHAVRRPLRAYQVEAARAIAASVRNHAGRTIAVMMSRQAGKNELSAQLEAYLLTLYQRRGGQIVKAAPTFKPQTINSILRLGQVLDNPLTRGRARSEFGFHVVLGKARCIFFSAGPDANVVGATASLLLELDEAQDIDAAKHDKDFAPMAASTNATRVYYGTAWDDSTLLARQIAANDEATRRDGIRRNFIYPWEAVAEANPAYGAFVQSERDRLGEDHPLFKTQFRLLPISGESGLFNSQQRALMRGDHPRQVAPVDGAAHRYVAGVDIAGPDEDAADAVLRQAKPRKDSTVVTIARVLPAEIAGVTEPRLELVDHYWWTGHGHRAQFEQLLGLLRMWRCARVTVDATGIGAGVAAFLLSALGAVVVEPFVYTARSKSELGFALLAAVNGGRARMYHTDAKGKEAAAEFWRQAEKARYDVKGHQSISFYVPEADGHDDFLNSLALVVRAASSYSRPPAATVLPDRPLYPGESRF